MKDILWLMRNTLVMTFRQKKNIILYLFMPVVGIFISLVAYGGNGPSLQIGVVDRDGSTITSDAIGFVGGLENVNVTKLDPEEDVQERITSGKLDSIITFEKGFAERIMEGDPVQVQVTSIKGAAITGYIKSYLNQYMDNIMAIRDAADGDEQRFEQMYEGYTTSDFEVSTQSVQDTSQNENMTNQTIGFLIMIMLISATNLSELILKEKEERTYYRLLSTPINMRKYLLSNVLVNMIVMIVQALITLTIMKQVFHIGMNLSFGGALLVMLLFSLISVGLSLVIVSFANSRGATTALQNLIIMPTVMLSGCFWPVEVMPESLQKVADFLPQFWTLDALTQIQEGQSISGLSIHFMILFVFAIAFFLLAVYRFSRNDTTQSFI